MKSVVRLVSIHPSIPVGRTNYHSGASSPWELICTVQSAVSVGMMHLGLVKNPAFTPRWAKEKQKENCIIQTCAAKTFQYITMKNMIFFFHLVNYATMEINYEDMCILQFGKSQ